MARGAIAKQHVIEKLQEAFEDSWIGESQKKYYVWADDDGEKVQIAISLTCPKVAVEQVNVNLSNRIDFENDEPVLAAPTFQPVEFTDEEKETVNKLLSMF